MYPAFESLFGPAGFTVRGVPSGEEALTELRRSVPAALVAELHLPGMDGLTLIRHARRERPHMPAVICTSAPSAAAAAGAMRAGADDFVLKHRDTAEHLRATLRRAMRRRARLAETERLLREIAELNDRFLTAMTELEREKLALAEKLRLSDPPRDDFRVLVVDDEPAVVAVLEALLSSQPGVHVVGVSSGTEARAALGRETFDLMLSDIQLGDDDGVALAGWLAEHRPETAVVLMTGYATLDSAVSAIQKGVAGYLRKPFEDLNDVLGKVLEVKEALEGKRRETNWVRDVHARNADFMARYRLLKTKLATLQREPS